MQVRTGRLDRTSDDENARRPWGACCHRDSELASMHACAAPQSAGPAPLLARDPGVMVRFYQTLLGMAVTDRGKDDWIILLRTPPTYAPVDVALLRAPHDRVTVEAQQIALSVGSRSALDTVYRRMRACGWPVDLIVDRDFFVGFRARDPEANAVEVRWATEANNLAIGAPDVCVDRSSNERARGGHKPNWLASDRLNAAAGGGTGG